MQHFIVYYFLVNNLFHYVMNPGWSIKNWPSKRTSKLSFQEEKFSILWKSIKIGLPKRMILHKEKASLDGQFERILLLANFLSNHPSGKDDSVQRSSRKDHFYGTASRFWGFQHLLWPIISVAVREHPDKMSASEGGEGPGKADLVRELHEFYAINQLRTRGKRVKN